MRIWTGESGHQFRDERSYWIQRAIGHAHFTLGGAPPVAARGCCLSSTVFLRTFLVFSTHWVGFSSGGDLAPSLGERRNFSRTKMRFFRKKFPFSRQKFLMTFFFRHRPGFSDFPFLFPDFPYLCYAKCHIWPFLSSQEKHLSLLCLYFHAHPTTLLLKILGGRMHGPSPL